MGAKSAVLGLLLLFLAAGAWGQAPLTRGVNLTGWFQAEDVRHLPFSRFGNEDFDNLKVLGVDGVRLPVNLAAFTGPGPEYRLEPRFVNLLDQALDGLLSRGLAVVLDNHSAWDAPRFQADRAGFLTAVWAQLASRYRDRGKGLVYEIQNEPHDVGAAEWDRLQRRALAAIRAHDDRLVVVTGAEWGSVNGLLALKPYTDKQLLYSFHFYDPFRFTHQGADWAGQGELSGVRFSPAGDGPELARTLDSVAAFAQSRGVTVFCGEFGVYNKAADTRDRAVWYKTVRTFLEERKFAWTMWDYKDSFGLFRKGSAEVFDQDLDPALVAALGFTLAPQRVSAPRRETGAFELYRDGWASGTRESVWAPSGVVDFYNPESPWAGQASLLVAGVPRYSSVAWDFAPWRDLSAVAEGKLVFWARSKSPRFSVDLRFVDSQAGTDLPWRLSFTLSQEQVSGDGMWHRVDVPLKALRETGAWDGSWHPPRLGSFSWSRVARFEIAAEESDLKGELGFDDVSVELSERP